MHSEHEFENLSRKLRKWRTSTAVLGLLVIGLAIYGFDKKIDLERAEHEGQKIREAVVALQGALGVPTATRK
jgi:hypothetical protein